MAADEAHEALNSHTTAKLMEYKNSLDAHAAVTKQLINQKQHLPQSVTPLPTKSSRFSNVHLENFQRSPNPYEVPSATGSLPDQQIHPTTTVAPQTDYHWRQTLYGSQHSMHSLPNQPPRPTTSVHHNRPDDSKVIPQTVDMAFNINHLTPVNHDQALKHPKVQFTGLGNVFIFYNQLLNAMEQFGIYLLPLTNVKHQLSLCPTAHRGIHVDLYRRTMMASTLYHMLQSSKVVPMECMSIRNIINWFAEVNDGYIMLYAMLELVHQAIQTNAVMSPPKSQDYHDNIHLYAQKFNA